MNSLPENGGASAHAYKVDCTLCIRVQYVKITPILGFALLISNKRRDKTRGKHYKLDEQLSVNMLSLAMVLAKSKIQNYLAWKMTICNLAFQP